MDRAWDLITDVLAGAAAIRDKGVTYLPKYEGEEASEYDRRRMCAPWRPEFADALRSLASKPFDQDVALKGDVSDADKDLAEDIDGRGNSMTRFAAEAFAKAIAKGLHCILVDFPTMEPSATIADERAANARPYWVQIEAQNIVALYTEWQGGKEVISHFRYRERSTTRDGFGETTVDRIRVYEPGLWQVWEKGKDDKAYALIQEGEIKRAGQNKASVPLVPIFLGERIGEMAVRPPLADLADMQIELYRAMSRQDEVLTFAGSPMLKGKGIPANTSIVLGPRRLLCTGEASEGVDRDFDYIQPAAANIAEIRNDVRAIVDDMRRLGMQPMTQQSGTRTATGESVEAAKAHSSLKAWALTLKDALELGWVFTAEWQNEPPSVEVSIDTDFDAQPFAQAPLQALGTARASHDLSQRTYWEGLRRFDVLPQDFDADAEEQRLAEEQQGQDLTGEQDIDPTTGEVLAPPPPAPHATAQGVPDDDGEEDGFDLAHVSDAALDALFAPETMAV